MNVLDRYWLAGILDADGYFGSYRQRCRVELVMADPDTVERVANLFKTRPYGPILSKHDKKMKRMPQYMAVSTGEKAVKLLKEIYPILSARRQARVFELIKEYDNARS